MLRNLFVSTTDTEPTPYVKHDLQFKRDRSFRRRTAELLRLLRLMRPVEVKSPGGIILRDDLAFDFGAPVINTFLTRMCRGLLWEEFRLPYFHGTFGWRMNIELEDIIYQGLAKFGRTRKVHDIFGYMIMKPDRNTPGWAIMNFYGSLEFWAKIEART